MAGYKTIEQLNSMSRKNRRAYLENALREKMEQEQLRRERDAFRYRTETARANREYEMWQSKLGALENDYRDNSSSWQSMTPDELGAYQAKTRQDAEDANRFGDMYMRYANRYRDTIGEDRYSSYLNDYRSGRRKTAEITAAADKMTPALLTQQEEQESGFRAWSDRLKSYWDELHADERDADYIRAAGAPAATQERQRYGDFRNEYSARPRHYGTGSAKLDISRKGTPDDQPAAQNSSSAEAQKRSWEQYAANTAAERRRVQQELDTAKREESLAAEAYRRESAVAGPIGPEKQAKIDAARQSADAASARVEKLQAMLDDIPEVDASFRDWSGRAELQKEYGQLQSLITSLEAPAASYLADYDEQHARLDSYKARLDEVRAQLEEGDRRFGNGPADYSLRDRAGTVLSSAAKSIAGGATNALATTADFDEKMRARTITPAQANQIAFGGVDAQELLNRQWEQYTSPETRQAYEKLYAVADGISDAAAQELERAKVGLNKYGKAGVDIATNLLEMGFDAAVGKLTGGGSLASMFVRVYGDEARQARLDGATLEQQVFYGAAKGGIEVLTEKIADGVAGIYGKGAADDITETLIRRLSDSELGQSVLRAMIGAANEGGEEVLSDLFAPLAEKIYKDESLGELIMEMDPGEVLYDFLIGAAVGGLGSVGGVANGQYAQANAENAYLSAMYERMGETPSVRRETRDRAAKAWEVKEDESGESKAPEAPNYAAEAGEAMQAPRGQETESQRAQRFQRARDEVLEQTAQRIGERLVQQTVDDMGLTEREGKILTDGLSLGSAEAQTYAHGIKEAFDYGKLGVSLEEARESAAFGGDLTELQFRHAWTLGAQKTGKIAEEKPFQGQSARGYESIEEFSRGFKHPEAVTEVFDRAADADLDEFADGFQRAYDMGRSGLNAKYATEENAPGLTDEQRKAAFEMGRADAAEAAGEQAQKVSGQQADGSRKRVKGTVKGEGVSIADLKAAFNDRQNTAYRLLTRYAEATGVNIVLYNSQADENGLYPETQGRFQWKDDTIFIDINSGLDGTKDVNELGKYTMMRTFSHEFTHFVEKWNAERYNEFREAVFAALDGKGQNVHDLVEDMQRRDSSGKMSYEQASREVVADAMYDILPDSTLVQQLADEHPTIFSKLRQKLREFTARLRQYYREIGTRAPREAEALKENGAYMESIVKMWDDIAKGAVKNYQGAKGEAQTERAPVSPKYAGAVNQAEEAQPVTRGRFPANDFASQAETGEDVRQQAGVTKIRPAGRERFAPNDFTSREETGENLRDMVGVQKISPVSRDRFAPNDFTSREEAGERLLDRAEKNAQEAPLEAAETQEGQAGAEAPETAEAEVTSRQERADTPQGAKLREEAVDALVAAAENSHLLEGKETDNERTESKAPDVRAEKGDRRDGTGTVRVSSEQQAGDVQRDAAGRQPDSVPSGEGTGAGRHGDRSDAERDGRSGSKGSSESGVQPGRDGLTGEAEAEKPEEKRKRQKKLKETVQHDVEQKSTDKPGGINYVIGDSLDLPSGSKARYKANVDAIRIVKQLEAENRNATPEEQAALARYVGWGGIPEAFDERKADWSREFAELKELLSDEEYKAARASTTNAHYTSIEVIRAMYAGLQKLGFKGGRMLEPASGVGNFVGAMPADMSGKVKSWTMVELDTITGLIARHLYPQNDVRIEGFEKAIIPDNFMDVAIGNVPFGNYPVVDRAFPKKITSAIHNYFFAKSLNKVRPGGLVMFITSSYTMNSSDQTVRQYIAKQADLLGAIRLPNTAFKGNAGTEVVTDILILKKRAPGAEYAGQPFIQAPWDYRPNGLGYRNEYFVAHPEMVMGVEATTGSMYRRGEYTVNPKTDAGSLGEQITKAFESITGQMDYPAQTSPEKTNLRVQRAEKGTRQGGYVQKDGKLYQRDGGEMKEVQTDDKTARRIGGMLGIRDFARQLLNAQQQGQTRSSIDALRKSLNKAYDAFVKEYGVLNSPANRKVFADDPDRFSLFALEDWDAEKKTAAKADIFKVDTIRPNQTITHTETVKDGLTVSRNTTGGVDVPLISRLTGKSEADVTRELIDSELAFKNRDGQLEPAETYLSGNVRAKLRDAQGLVGIDRDYQHNVDALKQIVPADIPHEQIFVQLGTPWIPEGVYSDFAAYILGGNNHRGYGAPDIQIHRSNQTGSFTVDLQNKRLKQNYRNMQEWGTPKRSFLNLLEAVMNSRSVTVTYKDAEGHIIVDRVATDAANEKIEQITKKFQEWLWEDEERTKDLEYLYNETFNNLVTPKYDGSSLTVNGLRAGWSLRPHQADAVQRVVSCGGNTLLAHRVGAGKTLEMAAAAMKLKELGIVSKPMFAVPKSLVAQWGKEFTSYFPAAKLLVAEQGDFTPANRKTFANRIATGNYDAIIVSYEQFEKIPLSDDFAVTLYQEQIDEIIQAINEAKEESSKNSMSVKDMEKKRKQLEAKVEKLTSKAKDTDSISFEQLGVDSIFVDEAHNFKNLFYTTSMNNVAGLGNKDGSQRAFDLYTKVRYLQQLNGGRGIVFATATPVMNSMSEMYIMQKYLQSDLLDQLGLSTFDAWAKQFGEVVNGVEIKPSGQGYRIKQSFSRFKNMSELQLLFRNFSDVLTQVPGLKIPKMKGGTVKIVECEAGEFQKAYMEALTKRADNVKNVDPSEDNMLKITSDGRKISYTQRMIDPSLPYEEGCKIYRCAEKIAEEYKASNADKGTQIVFCDMATPKGKSSSAKAAAQEDAEMDAGSARLYNDLKARLVKLGIPAREIAFIHDANTDAKKSRLFDDVNAGRVRVLIGSTGKMGVGMNAQKRVVAIHHLDAPWRPGDVEQRDGRAFRQGNVNNEVSKYVYVTKGSFDARLWDIIDRKSSFINQIMNGENVGRDVEDTGEVTLSAAEVKALASGSPLILEQVQLETDIKKLENLYMAHRAGQVEARKKLQEAKQAKAQAENRAANARKDAKHRTEESSDEQFKMTVGKSSFTDKKKAGKALMTEAMARSTTEGYTKIGRFAGFDILTIKTNEGILGLLRAEGAHKFHTYPDNTTLMVTNMQKVLNGLDEEAKALDAVASQKAQEIKAQEDMSKAPFPKQQELDQKRQRYNEVMDILNPKEEQAMTSDEDELTAIGEEPVENSIRRTEKMPYDQQLEAMFGENAAKLNRGDDLYVHGAQKTGIGTGLDGKPFFMLKRNFIKVTRQEASNANYSAHGIGKETMRRIPAHLESPALYVVGNGRVSVLTTEYVRTQKSDAAPLLIGIDPNARVDGLAANEIKTVYGRDGFADWIRLRAKDSTILAGDEKKAAALLRDAGLELSGPVAYAADLSRQILAAAAYPVNTELSTRRETLSNRELLRMAADEMDAAGLTDAERNALDIFRRNLDRLQAEQEHRVELGRQYKDQQFTKGGSRAEAGRLFAALSVSDSKIKALENRLLSLENKDVLKQVLEKARSVAEQQERQRGAEKLQEYRARREESAGVRKYRERVRTHAETLRKWLMSPSGKDVRKHVPAELQKTVADFLESIDFMSKTALRTGGLEITKADEQYLKNMKRLKKAIKSNADSRGLYSGFADLPEGFLDTFEALIDKTEEHIAQHSGSFVVNTMNAAELKELAQTLKTLKKYIVTMNEFHNNAMFQHAYDAGEETIQHLSSFERSKRSGFVYKFLRFDYMRPSYVFEHFGKGGQSIEKEFREGQATQAFLANRIIQFAKDTYKGEQVKAWSGEVKTFKLSGGEEIRLPVTHIMSLYCLNKRAQALTHIYGDGIRVANFKEKGKVQLDEGHIVSLGDVQKMIGTLTPEQIEVADALQRFMSKDCAEWGNYVSMARFDVEQFGEENYFPINSDGRYLPATADESPDNAGLYALLNMGFTKELRENANNRIILYDIFDVFANHTASMAQYRAFALPVLDALKWFNYKNDTTSVRDKLSLAFGAPEEARAGSGSKGYAESFVINLLRAYNGTSAQGDPYDTVPMKRLHRFNGAQIAYNLRVVIQQPTAITRAAMILSPAKLSKGLGMSIAQMRKLADEMEAHSGIAAWKRLGFYDTNISRGLTELIKQTPSVMDKVMDVGTRGAEQADRFTWAAMWYAAKDSVKRSAYSSEEAYMQAVTELFEEVIYKTQVVDSLLTKADFLRSKGSAARQLGSFMSEPSATVSMLADAYYRYSDDMQRGMSRSEAWRRNGANIAKTAGVYAIGQIILAAMQAVADAWRDDDEYDAENWLSNYCQKFVQAFKGNVVEELLPFGKIPVVSEIYETMKSWLDYAGVFDKLGLDLYGNDISSGLSMYLKYVNKTAQIIIDKLGLSGKESKYTKFGVVFYLLRGASGLTGAPLGSAMREVQSAWNNTVGWFAPRLKLDTYRRAIDEKYYASVRQTGISQKQLETMLAEMDTNGSQSYSQDEAGTYLSAKLASGEVTREQAEAMWSAATTGSKSFSAWSGDAAKKAEKTASIEAAGYSEERYKAFLAEADTNGNGGVSQDELGTYLAREIQAGRLSNKQADDLWALQGWKKTRSEWQKKAK